MNCDISSQTEGECESVQIKPIWCVSHDSRRYKGRIPLALVSQTRSVSLSQEPVSQFNSSLQGRGIQIAETQCLRLGSRAISNASSRDKVPDTLPLTTMKHTNLSNAHQNYSHRRPKADENLHCHGHQKS